MSDRKLDEVLRKADLAPVPGEVLMRKGAGNLMPGIGGWLLLTSNRLVFRSHAANVVRGVWVWPLSEISSTALVNSRWFVPNGLEVVLRSGKRVRFAVYRRRAWMDAIGQVRG